MLLAVHIGAFSDSSVGSPLHPVAVLLAVHIGAFSDSSIGIPVHPVAVPLAIRRSTRRSTRRACGLAVLGPNQRSLPDDDAPCARTGPGHRQLSEVVVIPHVATRLVCEFLPALSPLFHGGAFRLERRSGPDIGACVRSGSRIHRGWCTLSLRRDRLRVSRSRAGSWFRSYRNTWRLRVAADRLLGDRGHLHLTWPPDPRQSLGLSHLCRSHLLRQCIALRQGLCVAPTRREVEPLVRFDVIL